MDILKIYRNRDAYLYICLYLSTEYYLYKSISDFIFKPHECIFPFRLSLPRYYQELTYNVEISLPHAYGKEC